MSTSKAGLSEHREMALAVGDYYSVRTRRPADRDAPCEEPHERSATLTETLLQMRPSFSAEEAVATHDYIMSDGFLTEHRQTALLEGELRRALNVSHVLMTTSGTSALMLDNPGPDLYSVRSST